MIASLTRTVVPLLVSYIVGGLAAIGIDVTDDVRSWLAGAIGTLIAAGYYAVARWLEQRYTWASKLLGSTQQPLYADSRDVTKTP